MKTKAVKPLVTDLVTPAQIAQLKGVARKNVYRAIHEGKIAPVTVAGVIFVTRQDAEAWEPSQSHVERARGRKRDNIATAPNSPTATQPPAPAQTPQDGTV